MGSAKEHWHDRIEFRRDRRLAELLGITIEELELLTYDILSDQNSDGFEYGQIVQFDYDNDPGIMNKIKNLSSGLYVNLSLWDLEDLEEDEIEWEVQHSTQLSTFNKHLSSIPKIINIQFDSEVKLSILIMVHAHIVSALEGFLASTFIHNVINSEALIRKLIETDPEFGIRKFSINEIYAQHSNIKSTVATYLKGIIFHDLRKVKPMYKSVFSYDFGEIAWLFKAVIIRHDCVHRAGYDKDGNVVLISIESIDELITNCRKLVQSVDAHVQNVVR